MPLEEYVNACDSSRTVRETKDVIHHLTETLRVRTTLLFAVMVFFSAYALLSAFVFVRFAPVAPADVKRQVVESEDRTRQLITANESNIERILTILEECQGRQL